MTQLTIVFDFWSSRFFASFLNMKKSIFVAFWRLQPLILLHTASVPRGFPNLNFFGREVKFWPILDQFWLQKYIKFAPKVAVNFNHFFKVDFERTLAQFLIKFGSILTPFWIKKTSFFLHWLPRCLGETFWGPILNGFWLNFEVIFGTFLIFTIFWTNKYTFCGLLIVSILYFIFDH